MKQLILIVLALFSLTTYADDTTQKKEFDQWVVNSWHLLSSPDQRGLQSYDEYCKEIGIPLSLKLKDSKTISDAELKSHIQQCGKTLKEKVDEASESYNSEGGEKPKNCREYTIMKGENWLKAEEHMAYNPFDANPSGQITWFAGYLKAHDTYQSVMDENANSVVIKMDKNAVFFNKDQLGVNTVVQGIGAVTSVSDGVNGLGMKLKVKVINAECIELFPDDGY